MPTAQRVRVQTPSVHELRTLAIDFDGVCHAYSNGWQCGAIYDKQVEGTADALRQLSKRYRLVIFTARHNLEDVHLWLVLQGLRQYFAEITNRKPAAVAYLDDRAVRFTNWADALKELLA